MSIIQSAEDSATANLLEAGMTVLKIRMLPATPGSTMMIVIDSEAVAGLTIVKIGIGFMNEIASAAIRGCWYDVRSGCRKGWL